MSRRAALAGAALVAAAACSAVSDPAQADPVVSAACDADSRDREFERRIEPLLQEGRTHTCSQCHLTGLDLSAYVRETPCETYACLREEGLLDEKSPEKSRILGWIGRAEPDSRLITQDVIVARGRCSPCHYNDHPLEQDDAPLWIAPKTSLLLTKPRPLTSVGRRRGCVFAAPAQTSIDWRVNEGQFDETCLAGAVVLARLP